MRSVTPAGGTPSHRLGSDAPQSGRAVGILPPRRCFSMVGGHTQGSLAPLIRFGPRRNRSARGAKGTSRMGPRAVARCGHPEVSERKAERTSPRTGHENLGCCSCSPCVQRVGPRSKPQYADSRISRGSTTGLAIPAPLGSLGLGDSSLGARHQRSHDDPLKARRRGRRPPWRHPASRRLGGARRSTNR